LLAEPADEQEAEAEARLGNAMVISFKFPIDELETDT